MATLGPNDPYDSFKKYSEIWEKLINDFIHLWTNNQEFARMSLMGQKQTHVILKHLEKTKRLWLVY